MEQGTHNPLVLGSNPGGPTIKHLVGSHFWLPTFSFSGPKIGLWTNREQIINYVGLMNGQIEA